MNDKDELQNQDNEAKNNKPGDGATGGSADETTNNADDKSADKSNAKAADNADEKADNNTNDNKADNKKAKVDKKSQAPKKRPFFDFSQSPKIIKKDINKSWELFKWTQDSISYTFSILGDKKAAKLWLKDPELKDNDLADVLYKDDNENVNYTKKILYECLKSIESAMKPIKVPSDFKIESPTKFSRAMLVDIAPLLNELVDSAEHLDDTVPAHLIFRLQDETDRLKIFKIGSAGGDDEVQEIIKASRMPNLTKYGKPRPQQEIHRIISNINRIKTILGKKIPKTVPDNPTNKSTVLDLARKLCRKVSGVTPHMARVAKNTGDAKELTKLAHDIDTIVACIKYPKDVNDKKELEDNLLEIRRRVSVLENKMVDVFIYRYIGAKDINETIALTVSLDIITGRMREFIINRANNSGRK